MAHFKDEKFDKRLGSRIREARLRRGRSLAEVGEHLGVSYQQIQKYEKGINRISAAALHQLAIYLDLPPCHFFDTPEAASSPHRRQPCKNL